MLDGQTLGARSIHLAACANGSVSLTAAQLSMLLEGIDWRHPLRTAPPLIEM